MKTLLFAITSLLLISAPSFASGEIFYKKLKTGVTKIEVSTRLIISTKDHELSPVQMKAINSSLNNFLNLTHDYKDKSGEKFQLSFKVVALKDSEITATLPTDNFIDLELNGRASAYPDGLKFINYNKPLDQADVVYVVSNKAIISLSDIDPYKNTISHETLHLLGLDDRYHDIPLAKGAVQSISDKGFDDDIMNCRNQAFSKLHIESYVSLVRAARAQGISRFELDEVTNYNVGHISEKPMYLMQVEAQ